MNIHEYQAKELLAKFGVPVPAAAPGQYTTRDRPPLTSIAGTTSIRLSPRPPAAGGGS